MQNLIPKQLRRSKLEFFRGFTLIELLISLMWLGIDFTIVIGLPIMWYFKLAIFVFALFFLPPLIFPLMGRLRGWQVILLWIKFKIQPKTYQANHKNNTSLLVPYDCTINDKYIKTQILDDYEYYIAGFELKGFNLPLLSPETQFIKIQDLQDTFKACDFPITMMKMDLPLKFDETVSYYQQFINDLDPNKKFDKARKIQLQSHINDMRENKLNADGVIKTRKAFFIFTYGISQAELNEYCQILQSKLLHNGFGCELLSAYQLTNIFKLIPNPYDKIITPKQFKKHKNNLENLLSFQQFTVKDSHFIADGIYYAVDGIEEYPFEPLPGWGAYLAANEQTVVWNINPLSQSGLKKQLERAIQNVRVKQVRNQSTVTAKEVEYQIEAYQALIDSFTGGTEKIKNVNILFLSYGTTHELLLQARKRLATSLKELDISVNKLTYRQLAGFSAIMPKPVDPLILKMGQEMPCWTLASSFPFINSGLNDPKGLYLGTNTTGDSMVFDCFTISGKRKNHNQIIIGTSGAGKSYFTKKQIAFNLNCGRSVIVIDPEREYKKLCKYYDGQWVDTGNATLGRINPLQVLDNNFKEKSENLDSQDEKWDEKFFAPVSNHLRMLGQLIKILYPELSDLITRTWIHEIKKTYDHFDITNNTKISELKPNQFPTFDDLLQTVKTTIATGYNDTATLKQIKQIIELEFCNDGLYANLWNGYTTLNFNNKFIVYDVHTLLDQDNPKVTATQMFLILSFIKSEIKRNLYRDTQMLIVVDEAHLAIDKDNPFALNFMYQMVKRCRKYNAGMIITTQNINDFTGSEKIKKKTTAMLNNTQYTFIFNLQPQDLADVELLYRSYGGLSPEEKDFLQRADKGETLMVVSGGFERYCLAIEVSKTEANAFENIN